VNVIRHGAIGPNRETLFCTVVLEHVQVEEIIPVLKEDLLATISTLGHVIRKGF